MTVLLQSLPKEFFRNARKFSSGRIKGFVELSYVFPITSVESSDVFVSSSVLIFLFLDIGDLRGITAVSFSIFGEVVSLLGMG